MSFHLETITDAMQKVARVIFEDIDSTYYLAGGTALALRIGLRARSEERKSTFSLRSLA